MQTRSATRWWCVRTVHRPEGAIVGAGALARPIDIVILECAGSRFAGRPTFQDPEVHVATKTAAGLEPIDRLEEKIKTLVNLIGRLKNEQARAADENARLQREVDALQSRLKDAEGSSAEAVSLREERDLIRSRVTEMLQQLEGLNL